MLYDNENPVLSIVNAEKLCWHPGSFTVKPRQVCALAFRIQGTADMFCAGSRYFIDAGDILYMPQGLGYQVEYDETQMLVIHFMTQRNDPCPEVYTPHNRAKIHQLFLKAADLWLEKEPGYVNYCTAIFHEILGFLCAQELQEQLPAYFKKALDCIHQNFRDAISITEICHIAGISPTAFRQCFNTYYGMTPTEYIRSLRLEYARNLLAGGMSVEQAAFQCGIPDSKYFARLIGKYFGCTPSQLRLYGK